MQPGKRITAMKLNHFFQTKQSSIETKISVLNEAESRTQAGSQAGYVRESDFLREEIFREILSFERKRAERSKKNIILMLLDVSTAGSACARYRIVRHAAEALDGLTAQVSIEGWYKKDAVLGIIFKEHNGTEIEALREQIASNISRMLLEPNLSLKPALYSFPGKHEYDDPGSSSLFYPELKNSENNRRLSFFLKRTMDIAGGIAGLLLFSPLFIMLPLLIKATSKGPVLFRQERIGRYGEKFVFLKFRTMTVGNDPAIHQEYIKKLIREKKSYHASPEKGIVFKIKDDPRVTSLGKLLRRTSLDELPQFLNVLKGEMSLVGPRPPIPYELENYDLWHLRRVMETKPGITGLWQVKGRSSMTFDEMVRLDLNYAKEWSLWMDVKILLKTPLVMAAGKGAY